MEKVRTALRPGMPSKALRLYDMLTVAMTQQALLMERTDGSSCDSAESCCGCAHGDDERSFMTCATSQKSLKTEQVQTLDMTQAGLELAIFDAQDQRLVHWATGPVVLSKSIVCIVVA